MRITSIEIEIIDLKSGDLRQCLDFRDMGSPCYYIFWLIPTGKEVANMVLFFPLYGRNSKAFQAASSTSTSVIISNLAVIVCSFSTVSALVRFAEESDVCY